MERGKWRAKLRRHIVLCAFVCFTWTLHGCSGRLSQSLNVSASQIHNISGVSSSELGEMIAKANHWQMRGEEAGSAETSINNPDAVMGSHTDHHHGAEQKLSRRREQIQRRIAEVDRNGDHVISSSELSVLRRQRQRRMNMWSVDTVALWLSKCAGLPQYVQAFKEHGIAGIILERLSLNDGKLLESELGIESPIHRLQIAQAIQYELDGLIVCDGISMEDLPQSTSGYGQADEDGSGSLSEQELLSMVLGSSKSRESAPQVGNSLNLLQQRAQNLAKLRIDSFDTDGDHILSPQELQQMHSKHTQQVLKWGCSQVQSWLSHCSGSSALVKLAANKRCSGSLIVQLAKADFKSVEDQLGAPIPKTVNFKTLSNTAKAELLGIADCAYSQQTHSNSGGPPAILTLVMGIAVICILWMYQQKGGARHEYEKSEMYTVDRGFKCCDSDVSNDDQHLARQPDLVSSHAVVESNSTYEAEESNAACMSDGRVRQLFSDDEGDFNTPKSTQEAVSLGTREQYLNENSAFVDGRNSQLDCLTLQESEPGLVHATDLEEVLADSSESDADHAQSEEGLESASMASNGAIHAKQCLDGDLTDLIATYAPRIIRSRDFSDDRSGSKMPPPAVHRALSSSPDSSDFETHPEPIVTDNRTQAVHSIHAPSMTAGAIIGSGSSTQELSQATKAKSKAKRRWSLLRSKFFSGKAIGSVSDNLSHHESHEESFGNIPQANQQTQDNMTRSAVYKAGVGKRVIKVPKF